jgi:hypothetical protein
VTYFWSNPVAALRANDALQRRARDFAQRVKRTINNRRRGSVDVTAAEPRDVAPFRWAQKNATVELPVMTVNAGTVYFIVSAFEVDGQIAIAPFERGYDRTGQWTPSELDRVGGETHWNYRGVGAEDVREAATDILQLAAEIQDRYDAQQAEAGDEE